MCLSKLNELDLASSSYPNSLLVNQQAQLILLQKIKNKKINPQDTAYNSSKFNNQQGAGIVQHKI
jgi:hypothetical protein